MADEHGTDHLRVFGEFLQLGVGTVDGHEPTASSHITDQSLLLCRGQLAAHRVHDHSVVGGWICQRRPVVGNLQRVLSPCLQCRL